ncbi:4-(cytidine 5'-diphospho)-2-C-methyl-D-erythritol kinase [Breoghania sp. JC706]|uniref:4-(cytidine 5'-diphospho)-2-C-methyl-D-erythritol kinase n=1 Tax=Breoghania sp. JC706 TaxID=3117732 RepID=UPI00300AD6FB
MSSDRNQPPSFTALAVREEARAKINLALHVTGRRADGYHELDTLVGFPPFGDVLAAAPADDLSLTVSGPFAADLGPSCDNLVMRAASLLREAFAIRAGAALVLEKRLPVASGIGGGSADAAAALRALVRLWGLDPADPRIADIATRLGADVPMCLASRPLRASGIGEVLHPVAELPAGGLVLANPRVAVATPAIFKALKRRDNPPLCDMPTFADARALAEWLAAARNDLQPPAIETAPIIADVLEALAALPGALIARMSGSGATCFALFDDEATAKAATGALAAAHSEWWICQTRLA